MPHNKTVWEGLGCMALEEVCHWGCKFRGIKSHVRPYHPHTHTRAQCLLPLLYDPHHDDDGLWPSDPVSMPQLNDLIYQLPLVSVSPHRSRIGTKTPPNWHQPLGPDVCSAHCASCGHKLAHSLKPLLPHTQCPPRSPVPRLQFQYRSGHIKSPIHTASALTPGGKGTLSLIAAHTLSTNTLIIWGIDHDAAVAYLAPQPQSHHPSGVRPMPFTSPTPKTCAFKKLTKVVERSDPVDSPTSRWSPEGHRKAPEWKPPSTTPAAELKGRGGSDQ